MTFEYDITNIVVSGRIPFEVDLYKMAQKERDVVYEPETFPGLMLSIEGKKVLIFKKGRFILAGEKSLEAVNNKVIALEKIISKYKFVAEVDVDV